MLKKMLLVAALMSMSAIMVGCSGCSNLSGVSETGESVPLTQEQKIDLVCTGVTASVKAVTYADAAGKVNADLRSKFLKATEITDPVCGVTPYPTLDDAKMIAFEKAAEVLRGVVQKL